MIQIIGDIHEKPSTVRAFIAERPDVDKRIFLGDFFDDFTSTPQRVKDTIELIYDLKKDERNILLMGNHDCHYAYPFGFCSGWKRSTQETLNLHPNLFEGFYLSYEYDGRVYSHAGWAKEYLDEDLLTFKAPKEYNKVPQVFRFIGWSRGGTVGVGGPLWLDWRNEFKVIKGVSQVVGHTPVGPDWKGNNWNLDSHLKGYGIIEKIENGPDLCTYHRGKNEV